MREQSRDIERLRHIVDSIPHIEDFLRGKSLEQMKDDVMCYSELSESNTFSIQ